MKRQSSIIAIILAVVLVGCGVGNNPSEEIITVDVRANYPEKELILQDFMDVEYIPLETSNEYITYGYVEAVGKNVIVVKNKATDGDIFIFDRNGKGLRKINRLGRSGEEYSGVFGIVLDENKNELFVVDYPMRKILVYDLSGSYKRSLDFADTSHYENISNYDKDNLICFKSYSPSYETKKSCHLLVSKKDGSITKEIKLPVGETQTHVWIKGEYIITPEFCHTIPSREGWVLTRTSADTIYNYLPNGDVNPITVRTPSIQSMDPQEFLYPTVITDRYNFMNTLTKEFDMKRMKGFPTTYLAYDNKEKEMFQCNVLNNDYTEKMPVNMKPGFANKEIATCVTISAINLIEAKEEGQLKGKLKEIASKLKEDSNPVIMLVKHKK